MSIPESHAHPTNTDSTFAHETASHRPPRRRTDIIPRQHKQSPVDLVEDITARLITQIIRLLVESRISSDDSRGLRLELETLRIILTLTKRTIQTYERTPLGRNLANTIIPEVQRCCIELQESFDKIDRYRQGLNLMSPHDLWQQIWWRQCEVDELSSLRTKLRGHQKSFGLFLMALNS